MRFMSYNMQTAVSRANNPQGKPELYDLAGIAEIIAGQNPDVVALQEVDRLRSRSGNVDQAQWLGKRLGYHYMYSPALQLPQADGSIGEYGHAMLSRFPIIDYKVVHLWHREELLPGEKHWITEPRTALVARLQAETPICVIGLHLSTTADQQQRQFEQLADLAAEATLPTVMMGDFNAGFSQLQATRLTQILDNVMAPTPVFTFPNGLAARASIDHILISKHWQVNAAWVISERRGKSDHNPLVADLTL